MSLSWLNFILSLAVILLAMRRSRAEVRLYFWAQAIATLALFFGVKAWGNRSELYQLLYIGATLPVLETSWFIAWSPARYSALPAATLAAMLGGITAAGLAGFDRSTLIVLGEGVLLALIGWAMLLGLTEIKDKAAALGIGTLSVALSCFDFGYVLNADWERANRWVPSAMGIAIFGWIAKQEATWTRTEVNG